MSPDTKTCVVCGQTKSISNFYKNPGSKDGHRNDCTDCFLKKRKEWYLRNREEAIRRTQTWRKRNPDKYQAWLKRNREEHKEQRRANARRTHLMRTYGLSIEIYEFLTAIQGGRCAACDRPSDDLHVDHEHGTGRVRGLLCGSCNRGIGLLGDDPDRLESAAAYLRRSQYPLGCGDRNPKPRGKPRT